MQIWMYSNGKYEKMLVKPTKRSLTMLLLEKAKNPGMRFWKTNLDETCSDAEVKNMLRQTRFRKPPYFEEI